MTTLKEKAKELKLRISQGSRGKGQDDRIGFGLTTRVRKFIDFQVPDHLFKWGRSKGGGLQPSRINASNVEIYMKCFRSCKRILRQRDPELARTVARTTRPQRKWRRADIVELVVARSSPNPPTFKNIAQSMNRSYSRMGLDLARPFTVRELLNKWTLLFPPSTDANRTVEYLDNLKGCWPGLYFHTQREDSPERQSAPKLIALHIVWPWAVDVMNTLTWNVFCDATYNVTVFEYKVVMITCLDGNQQHRPLMCSFISRSTDDSWATVFDIFYNRSLVVHLFVSLGHYLFLSLVNYLVVSLMHYLVVSLVEHLTVSLVNYLVISLVNYLTL